MMMNHVTCGQPAVIIGRISTLSAFADSILVPQGFRSWSFGPVALWCRETLALRRSNPHQLITDDAAADAAANSGNGVWQEDVTWKQSVWWMEAVVNGLKSHWHELVTHYSVRITQSMVQLCRVSIATTAAVYMAVILTTVLYLIIKGWSISLLYAIFLRLIVHTKWQDHLSNNTLIWSCGVIIPRLHDCNNFWHKCCRESRQSKYTLFSHLT